MNDNATPEIHTGDHALIAAAQASDGLAELLRFLREGDAFLGSPFGEVEPACKFAEAALLCAEMDYDSPHLDDDERTALGDFIAACRAFIDDWVG